MNRGQPLVLLCLVAVSVVSGVLITEGKAQQASETIYYEETFDDAPVAEVVYEEHFSYSEGGWYGIEGGGVYDVDGHLETNSRDREYHWDAVEHGYDFAIPSDGTYAIIASGRAYADERVVSDTLRVRHDSGTASIRFNAPDLGREEEWDRQAIQLPLTGGTSIRISHRMQGGERYEDRGGRIGIWTDDVLVIRNHSDTILGYESRDTPLYVRPEWEGNALHGTTFHRVFNVTPAEDAGVVFISFRIRTHYGDVSWKATQLGTTIASGTVSEAVSLRTIEKELPLRDGRFTLSFESEGHVEIDDVRVVGYEEGSTQASDDPLIPADPFDGSLDASWGYGSTLGVFVNGLSLSITTVMFLSLILLIVGALLYLGSARRVHYGYQLMFAGVGLTLIVLLFNPGLNAVAWLATGSTEKAPLDEPTLEPEPPVYYQEGFESGTLAGWTVIEGSAFPRQVEEDEFKLLMTGDPVVIERRIHIPLGGHIDKGFVELEATSESNFGYSPPDEDAAYVSVFVNGTQQLDNAALVRSADGERVTDTSRVRFNLSDTDLIVRITVDDLNGVDEATVFIDDINVGATA